MPSTFLIGIENQDERPLGWVGSALHAEFLRLVSSRDPAAASRLHDWRGAKPYVLGPLEREAPGRFAWSWTALDAASEAAMREAIQELPRAVSLSGRCLKLRAMQDRSVDYEALLDRAIRSGTRSFRLGFESPTAFKQQGTVLPLPVPRLMIKSWLERWNAHAPNRLPDDLPERAERYLRLTSATLRTESTETGRLQFTGFVGRVGVALSADAPGPALVALRALLLFSEWAGTGAKTSFGFGRTRLIEEPARERALGPRLPAPPPVVPLP